MVESPQNYQGWTNDLWEIGPSDHSGLLCVSSYINIKKKQVDDLIIFVSP